VNFYKRYIGDYARDTTQLSLAEHGAYNLLLDAYYARGKPLPASLPALYRLCRATTKLEQEAVRSVVTEYFPQHPDGMRHNARADEEIAKWESAAQANREKGKLGGRPPKNPYDNPAANPPANPAGFPGVSKTAKTESRSEPGKNPSPESSIPDPRSKSTSKSTARNALDPERLRPSSSAIEAAMVGRFDITSADLVDDWLRWASAQARVPRVDKAFGTWARKHEPTQPQRERAIAASRPGSSTNGATSTGAILTKIGRGR